MTRTPLNTQPWSLLSEKFWQDFVENGPEDETLEMQGKALLEAILASERIRRGVPDAAQRQSTVDLETLKTLINADSDNPDLAHAMSALRKLSLNPTKAVEYIDRLITSRRTVMSQKMSSVAKNQRPKARKVFADIFDKIVERDPSISRHRLLQELKKSDDLSIQDSMITCNETRDEMTVDALPEALRRSKARISKKTKKKSC